MPELVTSHLLKAEKRDETKRVKMNVLISKLRKTLGEDLLQ